MSTTEHTGTRRVSPTKEEVDKTRALARTVGLEYVDLDRYPLNAAAASLLPEQLARRHHSLAVGWKFGTPVVAVASPDNVVAMDDVKTVIGRDIHAVVACASQVDAYIERMYKHGFGPVSDRAVHEPPAEVPPPWQEAAPQATVEAEPAVHELGDILGTEESEATWSELAESASEAEELGGAGEPDAEAGAEANEDEAADVVHDLDLGDAGIDAEEALAAASEMLGDLTEPSALGLEGAESETAVLGGEAPEPGESPALELPEESGPGEAAPTARERGPRVPTRATAAKVENADKPALADVLVQSGHVTAEEMQAALRESAATGRPLGEILSELGLVTDEDLIKAMADEMGLEFADLNDFPIDSKATTLIPEAMARRHQLLGIGYRGNAPIVTMANPSDVFALDDLRTLLGRDVVTVVSSPRQIAEYITRAYRHDKETDDAARNAAQQSQVLEAPAGGVEINDLHAVVEDAPIVKYVNLILRQALQERASDVHIEPTSDDLRIRFRIDGVLHDITRSPKAIQGGVTTRLKVMANLDIAEHRLPQDGRISLSAGQREIDLRVASLPTVHGEKVVLRILDKTNAMLDLGDLGFLPEVQSRYETAYRKPYGTILVTGPTGSGKSTTLYATLNALNRAERNLITVEDPVEYQLRGVNQVQVNPKAGLTFASALRSILRSDPDIILVGEIRDRETAVIAIEAALTGHLVLSSLHTNDAAGTPMRLVEMGVEPFLVGSAIDCVVAQRLARQLCENCAEDHDPTPEELAVFGWVESDAPRSGLPRFRKAVGCQACSRTGYRGRIAVHELLIVTEEIERAVIAGASVEELHRIATEQGTVPLRHDGLRKAALGLTSLEEVIRVVA